MSSELPRQRDNDLLPAITDIMATLDLDLRIQWANQAAGDSVNEDPEDLVGQLCYKVWHGEQIPCEDCPVRRTVQSGEAEIGDVQSQDGRQWHIRSYPLRSTEGKLEGVAKITLEITELKRAEKERDLALENQRILLDNIHTQVFYLTDERTYGVVNRAHAEFLGYNAKDMAFRDLYAILPEEVAEILRRSNGEVFASGRAVYSEEWLPQVSGEWRLLSIQKSPKLRADGTVEYVVCSAEDITERKQLEDKLYQRESELAEQEALYRSLVEDHPYFVERFLPDTTILFTNKAMAESLGYTPEQLEGKRWIEFIPDEEQKRVMEHLASFTPEDPAHSNENSFLDQDGTLRWHVWTNKAFFNERGEISFFQSIGAEITDRKRAEEALRRSENYYRAIFETSGSAMLILEQDTTISQVNSNFADLVGHSKQEIEGKKYWTEFVHPDDVEWMKEYHYLRRHDPSATPLKYEFRFIVRNGEMRSGYLTIGMIPDTTQSVVSLVDITERKQAEEALRQSEDHYRTIFETSGTAMFIVEKDSTISLINSYAEKLSGYSKQEIENKKAWAQFVHPDDLGWMREYHRALLKAADTTQSETEFRFINRQGEIRYLYLASDIISGTKQTLASCIDITEQKIAKDHLENQLSFEKIVADISNVFVRLPSEQIDEAINYTLKQAGEFFQVGRCYVFMFSEDGKLMSNTHEWCAEGVESQMARIQNQPIESLPWWAEQIRKKEHVHVPDVESLPPEAEAEKEEFRAQDICSILSIPLVRNGNVFGFLGMDAVKEKKAWTENHVMLLRAVAEVISNAYTRFLAEQEIEYLTFHDMLTGLYNRRYLENEMKRLDTERQMPIGLIMTDLNNFKLINDTSGHEAGDDMLRHTAEILRNSCRSEDIIVRWGGDEFVVFLPQTTHEETKSIGERIKRNFQETYIEGNPISLALGYAVKNNSNTDLKETLKEADKNMYAQKLIDKSEYKSQ